MTSHDVVARARRVLSVRKVGHAGTLDPMATGLLVLGVGAATRLLGYVGGHDKTYEATIRLGQATVTDDREGEVLSTASTADLDDDAIRAALAAQTGAAAAGAVVGERGQGRRPPLLRPGARRARRSSSRPGRSPCTGSTCTGSTRPSPDLVDVDVTVDVHRRHLHPGDRPRRRGGPRRRRAPDRAAAHRLRAVLRRPRGTRSRRPAPRCWPAGATGSSALTEAATTVFPTRPRHRRGGRRADLRPAHPGDRRPGPARRRRPGRPAGRPRRGRRPDRPRVRSASRATVRACGT